MAKQCYCCGKKSKFLDYDLANGKICDECFAKAKEKDSSISWYNISHYNGDYLRGLIYGYHVDNIEKTIENKYEKSARIGYEIRSKVFKWAIGIFSLLLLFVLWEVGAEFIDNLKYGDVDEYINLEAIYIDTIKADHPFPGGRSYETALNETFDSNEWSYFESDGNQIVQVVSRYHDLDETMILQFLITPTDHFGQFQYQPYAMQIGNQTVNKLDMSIVLTRIFDGEFYRAFEDAFLASILSGE